MPSVSTAGIAMDAAARSVAAILRAKPRAIFFCLSENNIILVDGARVLCVCVARSGVSGSRVQ